MKKLNALLKVFVLACLVTVVATVGVCAVSEDTGCVTVAPTHNDESGWSELPLTLSTGYYTYTVTDGNVLITNVDVSICGNVTIPSIIDGCPVTAIGDSAFSNCRYITELTIPSSIISIGDSAFYNCRGLTSVTIPESVTSIGDSAFYNCSALTSVTILGSVSSIGDSTFYSCSNLVSVTIPDSVISIESYAFSDCDSLASIIIPDGVISIGSFAFNYCDSLSSVTIPDSVTSIGSEAFYGCVKLVEVVNRSDLIITKGGEDNGHVANYAFEVHDGESKMVNKNNYLFYTYDGINYLQGYVGSDTELILPESYDGQKYQINQYAFYSCDGITGVTVPDGVTSIGNYAFLDCSALTDVTLADSVVSIGISAFNFCYKLESVKIFADDAEIDDSAHTFFSTATVYGYPGSTAEVYAEKYNREFVSLFELSFESKTVLNGAMITVDVSFVDMPDINYILIEDFVYDTELLELVNGEWNIGENASADWDSQNQAASATFEENTDCSGVVLRLTFKVKEDVWGETEITANNIVVTRSENVNDGGVSVRFSVTSGTVTVLDCKKGDVNGDKSVNTDDAIHLLRHTLRSDKYIINQIGDMNGDGSANSDDAIYLLRHILMPDKYLLK